MPAASKKKEIKTRKEGITKSKRADVVFPVGRIGRLLRHGSFFKRISDATPVFLASVLEFLVGEVLDLAGTVAKNDGRQRIVPTNIFTGIQEDANLVDLFSNIIISEGGFKDNIHEELFMKKKSKSRSQSQSQSQADGKDKDKKKDRKKSQSKTRDGKKSQGKSKSKGAKNSGSKSKSKGRGKSQKVSQAV